MTKELSLLERLDELADAEKDVAESVDFPREQTANWRYMQTALDAHTEIERLDADAAGVQAELASVKACWAEALENYAKIRREKNTEIERLQNIVGHAAALLETQHVEQALKVLRLRNEPLSAPTNQWPACWIPVEKDLPVEGEHVLIWWPYWHTCTWVATWDGHKWHSEHAASDHGDGPTHWMPLPKGPTEKSSE